MVMNGDEHDRTMAGGFCIMKVEWRVLSLTPLVIACFRWDSLGEKIVGFHHHDVCWDDVFGT